MDRRITLITMGMGNVKVLEETLKSFSDICDEVIYGDLLIFQEDRDIVEGYREKYNLTPIKFPTNYIYHNGFSAILNRLAAKAKNDWVIYMNTSEIKTTDVTIDVNAQNKYNTFFFDHKTDPHHWYRIYNRFSGLQWSGMIHEELRSIEPISKYDLAPLFRMHDLEKDNDNLFKTEVFNDIKEIVYFNQYIKLVKYPSLIGGTHEYWLWQARANLKSFEERLLNKQERVVAFEEGDIEKYIRLMKLNTQEFNTSKLVEFQDDKQTLI